MTSTIQYSAAEDLPARVDRADWPSVEAGLNATGFAVLPGLLTDVECDALAGLYPAEGIFRSHIHMARHGFGKGEYKYFAYPLPDPVGPLRQSLYPRLVPVANAWAGRMGLERRYPERHDDFLAECHACGQERPTPLLLEYGPGDYNCLHQDLYGDLSFPLQVAVLLSAPGADFRGGEFVLTEQRPRMQSRPHVVPLTKGDAVVFAVSTRPFRGTRGDYRVTMRHGVSQVTEGQRHTLGVIFHDAR